MNLNDDDFNFRIAYICEWLVAIPTTGEGQRRDETSTSTKVCDSWKTSEVRIWPVTQRGPCSAVMHKGLLIMMTNYHIL